MLTKAIPGCTGGIARRLGRNSTPAYGGEGRRVSRIFDHYQSRHPVKTPGLAEVDLKRLRRAWPIAPTLHMSGCQANHPMSVHRTPVVMPETGHGRHLTGKFTLPWFAQFASDLAISLPMKGLVRGCDRRATAVVGAKSSAMAMTIRARVRWEAEVCDITFAEDAAISRNCIITLAGVVPLGRGYQRQAAIRVPDPLIVCPPRRTLRPPSPPPSTGILPLASMFPAAAPRRDD